MSTFEIWAPKAKTVDLVSGNQRVPMQPGPKGCWRADAPFVEYSYSLDGAGPLPDPRSPWQPHGVHGPSHVVDHSQFPWKHPQWHASPLADAVIYELHIGTFTPEGTFLSTISKLPYLKDLGITHIELMPLNEFSGKWGWGYDGVDLYAPHHAYGTPDDLKTLVDACHEQGLAVLLDCVYNHLGPVGNYLDRFGPYFVEKHHTPWGAAINLDAAGSEEVRRYICDNALMWLRDYHFDGLRLDAIHALIDDSREHLLQQMSREVDELEKESGRPLVLIAENITPDEHIIGRWGMDAVWNDVFHHSLHSLLTGEQNGYYRGYGSVASLAHALKHGNLDGSQLVGFLQNHDQVGNRAAGDRASTLISREYLKVGAALVILSPFVPLLFQGEEWGARDPFLYFTQHEEPDVARNVSNGRKKEFIAGSLKTFPTPTTPPPSNAPSSIGRNRIPTS
jgi:maltooligosyltrehalose trehalohydrolase